MKYLIIGGTRSGKSAHAERLAISTGKKLVYIATAHAGDEEMAVRIAHHQQRRSSAWVLIEERIALADTLQHHAAADTCILVDCLTLWLTNLLLEKPGLVLQQKQKLLDTLPRLAGDIILIGNEVGMSVVADNALARRFVDESGFLHQNLATLCDDVTFVVAGLPQKLKKA